VGACEEGEKGGAKRRSKKEQKQAKLSAGTQANWATEED